MNPTLKCKVISTPNLKWMKERNSAQIYLIFDGPYKAMCTEQLKNSSETSNFNKHYTTIHPKKIWIGGKLQEQKAF